MLCAAAMMPTWIRAGAAFGALLVAACSAPAPEADQPVDEASEDLSSSFLFHCRTSHGTTGPELASIKMTKTHATFTGIDAGLIASSAVYTYNANYHPRAAAHLGEVEYAWTDSGMHKMVLIFDPSMRTGGDALASGGHGGEVTLEGPHISDAIKSMFCRR